MQVKFLVIHYGPLFRFFSVARRSSTKEALSGTPIFIRHREYNILLRPLTQFLFISFPNFRRHGVICNVVSQLVGCFAVCPLPRCSPIISSLIEFHVKIRFPSIESASITHADVCLLMKCNSRDWNRNHAQGFDYIHADQRILDPATKAPISAVRPSVHPKIYLSDTTDTRFFTRVITLTSSFLLTIDRGHQESTNSTPLSLAQIHLYCGQRRRIRDSF